MESPSRHRISNPNLIIVSRVIQNDGEILQVRIPTREMDELPYEVNERQNQRQRMTSIFFLLLFMMLFYDNHKAEIEETESMETMFNEDIMIENQVKDVEKQATFLSYLQEEEEKRMAQNLTKEATRYNMTGFYAGKWKVIDEKEVVMEEKSAIVPSYTGLYHHLDHLPRPFTSQQGILWMFLTTEPSYDVEVRDYMEYVTGQIITSDEAYTFNVRWIPIQGVYIKPLGKLYLYGERPEGSLKVYFPNITALNQTAPLNHTAKWMNASANFESQKSLSYQISPIFKEFPGRNQRQYLRSTSSNANMDHCLHTFDLQLLPNHSSNGSIINGTMNSRICNTTLQITAAYLHNDISEFLLRATCYALIILSICCFHVYLLLRQLNFANTQATISRMSLITIGQQAILDSYFCLIHLTIGIIAQSMFALFATISFMQLIIFSIFEMRHLLLVWKSRFTTNNENWTTMRRELTTLYSRFYFALLGGILLVYNFWTYIDLFAFLAYSFWIPQIIHNAQRNIREPLDKYYLYGISLSRLFIPLYFYGYTYSFVSSFPLYHGRSNMKMCFILLFWMGLQVLMLVFQRKLGPRFFIPKRFLPQPYDYHRIIQPKKEELTKMDTLDCVICMGDIELDLNDYMVTPCNHFFHEQCLSDWMKVKLECPTCRACLPSTAEEEEV